MLNIRVYNILTLLKTRAQSKPTSLSRNSRRKEARVFEVYIENDK